MPSDDIMENLNLETAEGEAQLEQILNTIHAVYEAANDEEEETFDDDM